MRIGVFGGSFDPVHFGHLLLAESAREQCQLDEVWFLPAAVPPHKQGRELSSAEDRITMLGLAVGGHEAFRVEPLDIDRGGVSYTVETLETLSAAHPGDQWLFIMGADSLDDLHNWRDPERICQLAIPAVAARPGSPPPNYDGLVGLVSDERLAEIRRHQIDMPQVNLHSTEIRQRVAEGRSIRYFTPRAVEKYIETRALYATPGVSGGGEAESGERRAESQQ